MPLDALGDAPGGLAEFRIDSAREMGAMLRQLCDGSVQVYLNARDGSVVSATLWSLDAERGTLSFSVEPHDPALNAVLECDQVIAVGYLDSVKLQFELSHPVVVHGGGTSVLRGAYPREMYRFQRRGAYRVRPLLRQAPVARMRHTDIAEMQLALRVLDLSIGGCALFLPDDLPPLQVGGVMNQVQIELDADTRFVVNMRLQHVTSLSADAKGVRLGCEFVRADTEALRTLQRFIDQTQKRSKLFALR